MLLKEKEVNFLYFQFLAEHGLFLTSDIKSVNSQLNGLCGLLRTYRYKNTFRSNKYVYQRCYFFIDFVFCIFCNSHLR